MEEFSAAIKKINRKKHYYHDFDDPKFNEKYQKIAKETNKISYDDL
jgi:hypothetical protein